LSAENAALPLLGAVQRLEMALSFVWIPFILAYPISLDISARFAVT
jgi:hypothetical protein